MLGDTEKERKKTKFLLISMYPLLRNLEDQERVQQILVEKKMKTETQEEIKKQLS